ncbi:MAG: hypothetical protein ACE5IL_00630 [Myxococcota bacterium]
MAARAPGRTQTGARPDGVVGRHLLVGWVALSLFAGLGLTLETLNGFKVGWYLDLANATRRELWTLAHAHGVLLGLVNLAFAATLRAEGSRFSAAARSLASGALIAATVLMPAGFLLGGVVVFGGDPNPAILLVPPGALALIVAGTIVAHQLASRSR